MLHTSNHTTVYRPEIDGLRALAVIAVIINHLHKDILPSGYLGVDIFFVISGYVITSSLVNRPSTSFIDFLTGFYLRRVKRLVPALLLCVFITGILICLFDPQPIVSLQTGIASLFGVSNMYLLQQATDYFGDVAELNAFTQTWSLGVEEQFYLLFPLLAWFSGFSRHLVKGVRNLLIIFTTLSIASVGIFLYLNNINQPAAYFLMPARLWEIGAGCILLLGQKSFHLSAESKLKKISASLVTVLLVAALFVPNFQAQTTIAVVLLTLLLIASLRPDTLAYNIFSHPWMVYIGLISYSLYLWHWSVLVLSRWTIGIHWWSVPFQVALMFILAAISYHCVEKPLRRMQWSPLRGRTIAYGITASIATAICLMVLHTPLDGKLYLGNFIETPTPNHITTTWWQDANGNYIEYCHVGNKFTAQHLEDCFSPEMISEPNSSFAYIIGDSHARNYVPAVVDALPERQVKYLTMGRLCSFLPQSMISNAIEEQTNCAAYNNSIIRFLSEDAPPNSIVFVGQKLYENPDRMTNTYVDYIASLARKLADKEINVVLLDSTAPPPNHPRDCVPLPWKPVYSETAKNCFRTRQDAEDLYKEFDMLAISLEKSELNVAYTPLRTALCVGNTCGPYLSDSTPIYHDIGHITEDAARHLSTLLQETLESKAVSW